MIGEFIIEFLGEVIVQSVLSLIEYPGAWLHWYFKNKRIGFKQVVENYFWTNMLISCLIYGVIILLFI